MQGAGLGDEHTEIMARLLMTGKCSAFVTHTATFNLRGYSLVWPLVACLVVIEEPIPSGEKVHLFALGRWISVLY